MKSAQFHAGFIQWAAERGSDTYVPIKYVASGPLLDDHDKVIIWLTGFGEKLPAAAAAARKLAATTGCLAIGVNLPFAEVVSRSTNTVEALQRLVMDAPHYVARTVAPERAIFLGGDSRGGGVATVAAGTGSCEALAALSPFSVTNKASKRSLLSREMELGWRLGVKTAMQLDLRETGNWRTIGGVMSEMGRMAVSRRFGEAMSFALSPDLGERARTHISQLHKAVNKPVRLFAAEQDTCFTWAEYRGLLEETIGAACCDEVLRTVPGPHSGMESQIGQRQLEAVGQWFAGLVTSPASACH